MKQPTVRQSDPLRYARYSSSVADLDHADVDTPPVAADNPAFGVSVSTVRQGVIWISVNGRLVGDAAATRVATVLEHHRAAGCRLACVDLSRSPMLDREGLDVLLGAHDRLLVADGMLVVVRASRRIERLLELTGLDQVLFTVSAADLSWAPQPDRATIARAIGALMGRARCSAADAIQQLSTLGLSTGRSFGEAALLTLRELAEDRRDTSYPSDIAVGASGPGISRAVTDQRCLPLLQSVRAERRESSHGWVGQES